MMNTVPGQKRRREMRRFAATLTAVIAVSCCPALAQTAQAKSSNASGLSNRELMNRPEVRILRVELQPGTVRAVHQHNDVRFHLFVPMSGTVQLSIGSDPPVEASAGEPHYIKGGTPHGFRNTGTVPAVVMEVFVRDAPALAAVMRDYQRGSRRP
jgi:mannose-6-phosphate isomerase-like protein (cupin superfamily)